MWWDLCAFVCCVASCVVLARVANAPVRLNSTGPDTTTADDADSASLPL